jgi:hypothetical protein
MIAVPPDHFDPYRIAADGFLQPAACSHQILLNHSRPSGVLGGKDQHVMTVTNASKTSNEAQQRQEELHCLVEVWALWETGKVSRPVVMRNAGLMLAHFRCLQEKRSAVGGSRAVFISTAYLNKNLTQPTIISKDIRSTSEVHGRVDEDRR